MEQEIERVPDPVRPKKRRPVLTRVIGSLTGLSLLVLISVGALLGYGWTQFTASGPLAANKVINIPEGATRTQISRLLQDEGVITDARVLNGASLVFSSWGARLRPGEYEFISGSSMANVFDSISKGRVLTYKLTVPEGWTSQMALARINGNEVLTGDAVSLAGIAEGALVADTMVFRRGKTRQDIVDDMRDAQNHLLEDLWARKPADSILKSKDELLVLASIVEKETGQPEERAQVAAVFLNRLKKGMRLQSDPTIIYGIIGGAGKLDRPLTKADIATATLYNTYQIDGLPPGPIASPGRAALEAVISPAQSNALFFVADGTGGHAFAETLEQHNANVQKWREFQKNGILLPGEDTAPPAETAAVEPLAAPTVEQPALPAPDAAVAPVTPAVDDTAVVEAAKTQENLQPVPLPVEEPAVATTGALPKPATPPPLPVEKKPKPVVEAKAETPAAVAAESPALAETVKFEPGSVVKINGKAVPVPKLKPKKR